MGHRPVYVLSKSNEAVFNGYCIPELLPLCFSDPTAVSGVGLRGMPLWMYSSRNQVEAVRIAQIWSAMEELQLKQ